MRMKKRFDELTNAIEKLTTAKEKRVAREYYKVLTELRKQIGVLYSKYSEDGKLTYEIMAKYDRLSKFEDEIIKLIKKLDITVRDEIYRHLAEVYQESYYRTGWIIETESKAKLAYAAVNPGTIEKAINNPINGLTLPKRLERDRRVTIERINQAITNGLTEGDTIRTMSKRLTEELDISVNKATRIVRTETHRIHQSSSYDSARHATEKGVIMGKTWNTVSDERVRSSHRDMQGQKVPVDEDFKLPSGARGKSPGNTGVASEDIHCRCYSTFEIIRVERPQYDELEGVSFNKWQAERVA